MELDLSGDLTNLKKQVIQFFNLKFYLTDLCVLKYNKILGVYY